MTSLHCRVFKPQSGLTHRRCAGMWRAACCSRCTMFACVGILGEWMSYTPEPIPLGYSECSKAASSSLSERDTSSQMARASHPNPKLFVHVHSVQFLHVWRLHRRYSRCRLL